MMITLPLLNLAAVAASTESPQADGSTTQAVNVEPPVSAGVSGLNTPPRFELGEPHYPKNVVWIQPAEPDPNQERKRDWIGLGVAAATILTLTVGGMIIIGLRGGNEELHP